MNIAPNNDPLTIFGQHDEATIAQMHRCVAVGGTRAVLCADGHKGYAQPIGGVVAYRDLVSISGVGFDIACGNLAIRTDATLADVQPKIGRIMDDVVRDISFGVGQHSKTRVDHPLFDDPAWDDIRPLGQWKAMAEDQLGTVGSGNHYVDVFADELDRVWVGVHFGSRGLGHKTATYFLQRAGGKDGMDVAPAVVREDSALGQDYLAAMALAGRYAYAGREAVARHVVKRILRAKVEEEVHNHHNYCIAGDQIVPTRFGPKRMVDVRAGDEVYAFDVQVGLVPTKVEEHWLSGRKPILRINTFNRSIRVSADHPIQVISLTRAPHPERPWHERRNGALAWKRAGEIAVGDIVVCAEGYYETAYHQARVDEVEFARFVGAFLGGGWTRADPRVQGHTVGLAVGGLSEAHTTDCFGLVSSLFPGRKWRSNTPGTYGLTVSDKTVHGLVTTMGIGATSGAKRLPSLAFGLSRIGKLALLAGYVDADGSVFNPRTSNHGRATFASVNRCLVEDLRELAISCDLRTTPVRKEQRETNFGPVTVYRCVLSADSTAELPLWHRQKAANQRRTKLGKPQALQASKIGYLALPDGLFGQVVQTIEQDGEDEVYDLTVSHATHSFVCEGMILHNCWAEEHGGETFWVVRKGATPAFPGQRGFIGGSMGDDAVIVEGVDSPRSRDALFSTVHGAGRVMSRTAAKGRSVLDPATGRRERQPGLVRHDAMMAWLHERGVELRGGDLDEAPQAYRRLPEVLAAHAGTIRLLHTLRPLGVAMAGRDVRDPYKD